MKRIRILYESGFLSPKKIFFLLQSVHSQGVSLITLLDFVSRLYPKQIIRDDTETISYRELFLQSRKIACIVRSKHGLRAKQKVGIICANHISLLRSLFAFSGLGMEIYLLNREVSRDQFSDFTNLYPLDFIVYDPEKEFLFTGTPFEEKSLPAYHPSLSSIESYGRSAFTEYKLPRFNSPGIVILTGGTSGKLKPVYRKPSVFNFLNPFCTLLNQLHLSGFNSIYIAPPVYHGFGLAATCMSFLLGAKIYFSSGFDAEKSCDLIFKEQIETVALVPLMLNRMMVEAEKIRSLQCIISGGASLSSRLVGKVSLKLKKDILFNLYGTSEGGFCVLATPKDLDRCPETIGKPVSGVRLKILDEKKQELPANEIGQICISSRWSARHKRWIESGDLGYKDEAGYIFLCGREDEMIVSGGENVYPIELETILSKNSNIKEVAVIGMDDEEFGQRLWVFIVPKNPQNRDSKEIQNWLKERITRYQTPKKIIFLDDIPHTPVGKPDKKRLKRNYT